MRKLRAGLPGLFAVCIIFSGAALRAGEPASAAPATEPAWKKLVGFDEWGGLYMAGKKCGWLHGTLAVEKDGDREVLAYRSRMTMKMQYNGVAAEMRVIELQKFAPDTGAFLLLDRRVETAMPMLPAPLVITTRVVPDGEKLKCSLTVGAKTNELVLPKCKYDLEAALAAQVLAIRPGAREGDRLESEMPLVESSKVVRVVSTVKGRKSITFRGVPTDVLEVEQALYDPPAQDGDPQAEKPPMARMTVRIDAAGRPLEGDVLGQFTFRLEGKDDAQRMDAISDVMLATGVELDKPVKNARRTREVVLRLTGMPAESALSDDRQKYEKKGDGEYLLTLRPAAAPEKSAPLTEEERTALAAFLSPTPFLQSDDPKIKAKAAEVVAGEKDPWKAAQLLCSWVFRSVDKVFTPVASNASDTLATMKGDCGEHSALFVALCRAAGIPAREAAGLAYTDSGGKPVLGGHAWAEVRVGGRWVAMDPTFGEILADPLHIKIGDSGFAGVDGLIRLADLLGKVKVEVVSAK